MDVISSTALALRITGRTQELPGLVNVYIAIWKDPLFYSWVNPLFLWPFSIVFCMFTRGYPNLPAYPSYPLYIDIH
jgi:hypothetical protein